MKTTKQSLTVFATVLVLLVSYNTFAQQKSRFGIKGGINASSVITNSDYIYFTPYGRMGFNVFLSYDFFSNNSFVISGETGFDQKGFNTDYIYTNKEGVYTGTATISNSLNYFDISVNGKYIIRGKSASPYFSLTPTLGIYIGNSLNVSGDDSYPDDIDIHSQITKAVTDSLNSVSFGIKAGLGVEVNEIIKNAPLLFEVRWNPDLTQAFDNDFYELKNTTIEFNLGIKF